jgi:glycosyltransferase involved in cell wall biosynthesis
MIYAWMAFATNPQRGARSNVTFRTADPMPNHVLIVSNLEAHRPFGQFTRPFYLGEGLRAAGWAVSHVAVRTDEIANRVSWQRSTGQASVRAFVRAIRVALREVDPDIVYCHQNLPAVAGLCAMPRRRHRLVADFHSLPSVEWAETARATDDGRVRLRALASVVKTAPLERLISRAAGHLVAAGHELRNEIDARHSPRKPVLQVNNGVLIKQAPSVVPPPWGDRGGQHNVVATIPRETSPANDAAIGLLDAVATRLGPAGVRVHVVGSEQPPGPPTPLAFHGMVDAVEPWLAAADACLLPYPAHPALAGGARNKLLEGLAYGRRLVTTEEGLRGFRGARDWHGLHVAGDTPDAFADAIASAIDDQTLLPELVSDEIRALSWREQSRALDAHFRSILDQ